MTSLTMRGPYPQCALIDLLNARDGGVRHAASRVTGAAATVVLPAPPTGAAMLRGAALAEFPEDGRWDDGAFRSVTPWVCDFAEVEVQGDGGIVLAGGAVVRDTLVHCPPLRQGHLDDAGGVLLLGEGPAERLAGSWLGLLCGSHWNYYHWMVDGIGRLAAADAAALEGCDGLLIPADLAPFAVETLWLAGFPGGRRVRRLRPDESVLVERMVVPWRMADGFWPHPDLRRFLGGLVPREPDDPALPRRIYVDRRGGTNRRLANEDTVVAALARFGVVPVTLEGMTVAAQAALFRGAELVVAPHGAGLANLVFAARGCRVVELQMDAYANWCFRRLAAPGGLAYDCVLGRAEPAPAGTWVHGRAWSVDPGAVVRAVAAALGGG